LSQCRSSLEILCHEFTIVSESDFYVDELDGEKSEQQACLERALNHSRLALTSIQNDDKKTFRFECSLLILSMNDFLLSTVDSNKTYLFQFVWLLTIISILCIVFVFVGFIWIKIKKKIILLAEQNRQERVITSTITHVQESERSRISRDLHDTVTQDIRTALLFVHKLENSESLNSEQKNVVQKISQLEMQNLKNIRNIIRNLTPSEIENSSILTLLAEFAASMQDSSGLPCKFYAEPGELYSKLDSEQKLNIFRIVQESVNNSLKHSGASEISIIVREVKFEAGEAQSMELAKEGQNIPVSNGLIFLVSDDGHGFLETKTEIQLSDENDTILNGGTHLGLVGMKSRANLLGAKLEIKSDPETGTQVKLFMPLKQK